MALKGTTKIELTNVKTGEVETVEKHNMVTNALKWVLSNPFCYQNRSEFDTNILSGSLSANLYPLCRAVIGGVLAYESKIPELPDQLYAQPENRLIGYANTEANTGKDIMRGSLNVTESGLLESGDGYRFVFDFNTSQGNGTISSIGLTSYWGGNGGYGGGDQYYFLPYAFTETIDRAKVASDKSNILMHMIGYDEETDIAVSAYVVSQGVISIYKVKLHTKYWDVAKYRGILNDPDIIETKTIETQTFAKIKFSSYNFCCSNDGFIWGFEHKDGVAVNKSGVANVNWIKIDIETLEAQEGTWNIDAQLGAFGNQRLTDQEQYGYSTPKSAILNGMLYCNQEDGNAIVVIDMNNITNVKKIKVDSSNRNNYEIRAIGNKINLSNGYINVDKCIISNAFLNAYGFKGVRSSLLINGVSSLNQLWYSCNVVQIGTFLLSYFYEVNNPFPLVAAFSLVSPYLVTINNLPAPVEKTADKTMKITYIIREEADT